MIWNHREKIFCPNGHFDWMKSHAQVPRPLLLNDIIRVFFATRGTRDAMGNYISNTTFIDVDAETPSKIRYIHNQPILSLGPPGSFSQHGISPGAVLQVGKEIWMYYAGWSRQIGAPYQIAIGLAISRDQGRTFEKFGHGPVLDRAPFEPYGPNSLWVGFIHGNWYMVYSAVMQWRDVNGHLDAEYFLCTATSKNGIEWERTNESVFRPKNNFDCQCVPTVLFLSEKFFLWYSHRVGRDFRVMRGGYYVNCLISEDFKHWYQSPSDLTLTHSRNGFDSDMVCYPGAVTVGDSVFLFYSGNEFGKQGIGLVTCKINSCLGVVR